MVNWTTETIKKHDLAVTDSAEGLVSNRNESTNEIVSFLEEGEVTVAEFPDSISAYKTGLQPSLTALSQDIRDYLARPLDMVSYTIQGSSFANTYPEFQFDTYLTNPAISSKIAGFQAMNFKIRVRLVVNADPFLQGRLLLVWIPQGSGACPNWGARSQHLTTITQFPHIELDIATQTTAIMEIPFMYPLPYYPNPNNGYRFTAPQYCSFLLYNYGSIATGTGSTSCNATLYISIHDVELAIPGPQSSGKSSRSVASVRKGMRKTLAADPELNRDDIRPISGALRGLSFAANAVKNVPLISSIATPAAWVLENLSHSAKSFGFCNPEVAAFTNPFNQVSFANLLNADVPSYHQSLALTRGNTVVGTSHLKGNDEDELSLASLLSRPAYILSSVWTTSNGPGTVIYSVDHGPGSYNNVLSLNGTNVTFSPPITYFSIPFNYWRGGIVYRFKMVKTKYHSGRLMVSYYPAGTTNGGPATLNSANSVYTIRRVIDISELTEFEVIVPFLHVAPYAYMDQTLGKLVVTVVNELVAPSTVNTSIQLITEVSAAEDFEIAMPNGGAAVHMTPFRVGQPQGGQEDIPDNDKDPEPTLGGSQMLRSSLLPAEVCIGEKINSLRTLLKRPNIVLSATNNNWTWGDPSIAFTATALNTSTNSTPSYTTYRTFSDYYSVVVSCFYLNRGAINIKLFCPVNNTTVTAAAAGGTSTTFATRVAVTLNKASSKNRTYLVSSVANNPPPYTSGMLNEKMDNAGIVSFSVPFYSPTPWLITSLGNVFQPADSAVALNDFCRTSRTFMFNSATYSISNGNRIYRSVADDFDVGCFLSTMPYLSDGGNYN